MDAAMRGDGLAGMESATRVQLAVDIGTRWVKIAYAGPDGLARPLPAIAGGKPGLAPLLFYVPGDACRPLIGEEALRLLGRGDLIDFRKLAGAVVRLQDRITTPGALYTELFRYVKSRARTTVGDVLADAPLLISVSHRLDQESQKVLAQAARDAGFADADFIDLPVSIATAWASTVKGSASRSSILLVDIGACAVSWTLLDNQGDGSFQIDWTMPPGELRDHGAEDVELGLLEHLSVSLAPSVAQAMRATRDVVQDELRRAKEQISAAATTVSILVDGRDIRVDERMVAKAASNLLETVATLVANQLAELENIGKRKPMVLLAGGGARTPGLAARLAELNVRVTTWEGQATGGATGALLLARRPAWVELKKQERAARRRRAKYSLAGAACLLALYLLCVGVGWFIDKKEYSAALATIQDAAIPPAQAIGTVKEYLTETFFRTAVARIAPAAVDFEGRRTQAREELSRYVADLASRGAAEMAALEHEFRWPPDSQSPARLRAITDDMRMLLPLAPQAQPVGEQASRLADLADAALAAETAKEAAVIPSNAELDRIDRADLEKIRTQSDRLYKLESDLARVRSLLPETPNNANYQEFLVNLERIRHQLDSLVQRRTAAIVCSDAQAELADPGSRSDYARIGADLAKLPADLCDGKVASLQRIFSVHEQLRALLDQLRRDAAPLIEVRNIPKLKELLVSRWPGAATGEGLQPGFGAWLDRSLAQAEDQALQHLPSRIHNTADRDQIVQELLRFRDTEAGIGTFPYHRPDSITQHIQALQTEVARVAKALSQGVTVGRVEFLSTAPHVKHKDMEFACPMSVFSSTLRRVLTIADEREGIVLTLETLRTLSENLGSLTLFKNTPDGFICSDDGTHASWTTHHIISGKQYKIHVGDCTAIKSVCLEFHGKLDGRFRLSPDSIIWISDGGTIELSLDDNYVLRITGVLE